MENKRGLSEVITTLIIILLVIAAIGIIWAVVNPFIRESSEEISLAKFTLDLSIKQASVDTGTETVSVGVKRGQGEGDLVGLKFVMWDGSNSVVAEKSSTLAQQEMETYYITASDIEDGWGLVVPSGIIEVSVAPVYATTSGTAVTGEIADTYIIGSGSDGGETPCVPDCIGKVCGSDGCVSNGCGTCISGSCVAGVCEGCTPETCLYFGYECGAEHNDGCGGILDCSSPGCTSPDTCVNSVCVPPDCVPEDSATTCALIECGITTNNCGEEVDCDVVVGGCVTGFECIENVCQAITFVNSGIIDNVWPPGAGIYFDDDALPLEQGLYEGAAAYFPIKDPTTCHLIVEYNYDATIYANAIIKLYLYEPLGIVVGDAYEVWETKQECMNANGL